MKGKSRVPTIALILAIFAAVIALILAVLLIGTAVHVDSPATQQGATRVSIAILILGGVVMVPLFAAFLFIGIEDWRHDIPISALYWPQVAVKGAMCAYMMTLSPSAVDLLVHGLQPRWTILYTPVARIFQSVLLFAVFASFAWVLATILAGRADERKYGKGTLAMRFIADLKQQIRDLVRRQDETERRVAAEETRNDVSEARSAEAVDRADRAEARADLAEQRADTAHIRADETDSEQGVQDERLEISETTITKIEHTIEKKPDGAK